MLCVFPVSKSDKALAFKVAGLIASFGGVERHRLLVVGTRSTVKEASEIREKLTGVFGATELFVPETECEIGWPNSANHLFHQTVTHLWRSGNKLPWYWFEADCTPLRPSWLDEIEVEYNTAGKPYLGAVQKTRLVHPDTGEFVKHDGEHVIGSCVYPADFGKRSTLWRYIRWDSESPVPAPWDVYLRHEIRLQAHVSEKIKSNWRTKNYQVAGTGRITCDPIDETSVDEVLSTDVAVIHGCKDGSLIDALLSPKKKRND
jgi:hypothetical protein